jgi:hypothetical protein
MRWLTTPRGHPRLTPRRVRLAYAIGVLVDVLEWVLGPFGWAFTDEILDVAAMSALWPVLGFHPLLLPTFVIEFLPVADLLPTWTGCVALVVALRRREEQAMRAGPGPGPVIDI